MANQPLMTDRTITILRALLSRPEDRFTCASVTATTGVPAGTVGPLLARLASFGWLTAFAGAGMSGPYQLTDDGVTSAREALRRSGPRLATAGKVWTLTELEAAVAAGEQPRILLEAVRAALKPRRKAGRRPAPGATPVKAIVSAD